MCISRLACFCALLTLRLAGFSSAHADDGAGAAALPLVFCEDFEQGSDRWETTDSKAWDVHQDMHPAANTAGAKRDQVFGLNRVLSDYQPRVRSPHNIALIKDIQLEDFELTVRVRSTKDTGNHRDCCLFFCHQDPEHFYYVHLGARPDPHSGQIMIVNGQDRVALTQNNNRVPWDNDWHTARVIRNIASGTIDIYFDDMQTPLMQVVDKTFAKGRVGIGSFDDMNDFDDIQLRGR